MVVSSQTLVDARNNMVPRGLGPTAPSPRQMKKRRKALQKQGGLSEQARPSCRSQLGVFKTGVFSQVLKNKNMWACFSSKTFWGEKNLFLSLVFLIKVV